MHARHLLRPAFDENTENQQEMDKLSQEISKLITSAHRHIQHIRSCLDVGTKSEQRLTSNVAAFLLISLQELSIKFRNSQNMYLKQLNIREERSQKFFDDFTKTSEGEERENYVDSFDNFLQLSNSKKGSVLYDEDICEDLDGHFQRPSTSRMLTQQQLLLFEEENSRLVSSRDEEVTKIVKSIYDLNDIFKDLGHMVHEQGTILDRIDYSIEQTQTRVSEGLRQLHRAEMYQRKNRKMCVIMVLAGISLSMLLLLIFTKI